MKIEIEISPADLLDRHSILKIKERDLLAERFRCHHL